MTERQGLINSASDPQQEYIYLLNIYLYFIGSPAPPSACYIYVHKVSIPFLVEGYKKKCILYWQFCFKQKENYAVPAMYDRYPTPTPYISYRVYQQHETKQQDKLQSRSFSAFNSDVFPDCYCMLKASLWRHQRQQRRECSIEHVVRLRCGWQANDGASDILKHSTTVARNGREHGNRNRQSAREEPDWRETWKVKHETDIGPTRRKERDHFGFSWLENSLENSAVCYF